MGAVKGEFNGHEQEKWVWLISVYKKRRGLYWTPPYSFPVIINILGETLPLKYGHKQEWVWLLAV